MTTAEILLARLDRIRETGNSRWIACCPAHDDSKASLSIRELDDGRVLMHCFAGCAPLHVLGAVGLELSALFPPRDRLDHRQRGERIPFPAIDVLRAVANEAAIAGVVLGKAALDDPLDEVDRARAVVAAGRLLDAATLASPGKDWRKGHRLAAAILAREP